MMDYAAASLALSAASLLLTAAVAFISLRIKLAVTELENRILLLLQHEYISKRECSIMRSPHQTEAGLCGPSAH